MRKLSRVATVFALALVGSVPLIAQPSAQTLLEQSIDFHDPGDVWSNGAFRLDLEETRPNGADRETTLWIDNGAGTFRIERKADGHVTEGRLGPGDVCDWTLDGSAGIDDAEREERQLTCDRLTLLGNYYRYLWGLPMKLRDPGTNLGAVTETEVDGKTVYRLRVTYDEEVGNDIWDFDFDPNTYALVGYRFEHGDREGGERITLDGLVGGAWLKLPAIRTWYRLGEDEPLGADALIRIGSATGEAISEDGDAAAEPLDPETAVRATADAYVRAWLANDPEAVMATLTDDAVLMPQGLEPITGHESIRSFWWPADGPTTTITDYQSTYDDVEVGGDLAFVRGRNHLTFTTEIEGGELRVTRNESAYLMVLRRGNDGRWRIARRMWGRV